MPPESPTTRRQPPLDPRNYEIFDPWNSASTGHQRAENPYSNTTAWRDTRAHKLERQFRSGDCADVTCAPAAFDGTVGPSSTGDADVDAGSRHQGSKRGSGDGDEGLRVAGEWRWVSEAEATKSQLGVRDIRSFMGVGKRKAGDGGDSLGGRSGKRVKETEKLEFWASKREKDLTSQNTSASRPRTMSKTEPGTVPTADDASSTADTESSKEPNKTLFSGTTFYVNGSTLPQISDHKLKHLLVSHGARISIAMARKTVSHVIVGQPGAAGTGAGGGLSARKLQQEIERGGWRGVKVVSVDW